MSLSCLSSAARHTDSRAPYEEGARRAVRSRRALPLLLLAATAALCGCVGAGADDLEDESEDSSAVAEPLVGGGGFVDPSLFFLRRTFSGDAGGFDQCNGIAAGPGDTILVTGEVRRVVQEGTNAWSRAYSLTGATLWTKEVNTPSMGSDRGSDILALPDGSAVVAGSWTSTSTGQNNFLQKISPAGAQSWWRESAIVGNDRYLGVARDGAGALIAVGSLAEPGEVAQAWIRKLSADGSAEAWSLLRSGSSTISHVANKVGVDSNDDVIAVGQEWNTGAGSDGWIAKYSSDGAEVWSLSLSTIGGDQITDVAVASDDTFAVVGNLEFSSTIRAYTAAGALRWHVTAQDGIVWRGVAVDASGNVLVTGSQANDLIVRKYTSAGAFTWQRMWSNAKGNSVAVDSAGRVLVCGAESVADGATDGLVLRYVP